MAETYSILVPFFIIMFLGVSWKFVPSFPQANQLRQNLSTLVLNIFMPALTLHVMATTPFDSHIWIVPLLAGVSILTSVALTSTVYGLLSLLGSRFCLPPRSLGALLLAASWGNITFLGLPVITAFYGPTFQHVPFLFDLLAMAPLLYTLGVFIATRYGDRTLAIGASPVKQSLMAMLRLPPLWAALAGVLLQAAGLKLPDTIDRSCVLMGQAVAPLMIFCVGLAITSSYPRRLFLALPAVLIKLVAAPLSAWSISQLRILEPAVNGIGLQTVSASIVEAGMPTMVVTIVLADRYGLDGELLAQLIALSTMLSFVTLPILHGLL